MCTIISETIIFEKNTMRSFHSLYFVTYLSAKKKKSMGSGSKNGLPGNRLLSDLVDIPSLEALKTRLDGPLINLF